MQLTVNGGEQSSTPWLDYSWHALYVMAERLVPPEWVERTVVEPALRLPDPNDKALERFYRPVPENENRVLRVVVNTEVAPWRVISVFFDRRMRGQL